MNRFWKSAVLAFLLLAGCQHRPPVVPDPVSLEEVGKEHRQALVVTQKGCSSPFDVTLRFFDRSGGPWREAARAVDGVAGRKGIAPPGEKREGDGRTPSGTFTLERAFGYGPLDIAFPYLVLTPDMIWIDDPKSPLYNRLATRAEGAGLSYEIMKRDDDLYKFGVVIEYNTRTTVSGAGSAIFFHIWRSPSTPTAGCVAVAETDIIRILRWLDRERHPVTVIAPPLDCDGKDPVIPPAR